MVRTVSLNKEGMTLIEVTIALLILLIVFLALMQTALVSIGYNMNNVLRDEAVSIADMRMDDARSLAYTQTVDNLLSDSVPMVHGDGTVVAASECPPGFVGGTSGVFVERNLKNIQKFPFCTFRAVNALDNQTKQVTISVWWTWKGENFNHTFTTIVRQQ